MSRARQIWHSRDGRAGGERLKIRGLAIEAGAAWLGVTIAMESLLAAKLAQLNLFRVHSSFVGRRVNFVLEYEQRMADNRPCVSLIAVRRLQTAGKEQTSSHKGGVPGSLIGYCASLFDWVFSFTQDTENASLPVRAGSDTDLFITS